MYAIVDIAGKQFKVKANDQIFVPRLKADVGEDVTFDRVLLVSNDDDVQIGGPVLDGASISARVVEHVKADKVIVFKKKRRKGYKVKRGHRQPYTKLEIAAVSLPGKGKKAKKKSEQPAEEETE